MRSLAFALIAALVVLAVQAAEPPVVPPLDGLGALVTVERALPAEYPLTVVAVVDHEGNLYSLHATMPDGALLSFDQRSPVPWQLQLDWAKHARHSVTVIAPYTLVGGQETVS